MLQQYRRARTEESARKATEMGVVSKPGGCQFFIARRQRFCSNMVSSGSLDTFCHQHSAFNNGIAHNQEKALMPCGDDEIGHASNEPAVRSKRKHNMTRPPKHMLNPFKLREGIAEQPWSEVFSDLSRPLLLDIGCAKGRWIEEMAAENPVKLVKDGKPFNYCGVELYGPLMDIANAQLKSRIEREGCQKNLHYVSGNINNSLQSMKIPNLHTVCIQFPDPWIKKRKRRVVSEKFAMELGMLLPEDGQVYISTDYHELAVDMRSAFLSTGLFESICQPTCDVNFVAGTPPQSPNEDGPTITTNSLYETMPSVVTWKGTRKIPWLKHRPFFLGTERDKVCEQHWRPNWRCLFRRTQVSQSPGFEEPGLSVCSHPKQ